MKTIEILSGSQKVQFTTKSATFDNKEFLYAHMTHVVNDAENCTYTFTYEGETKTLPYLEKDAKILNAIFSQVQKIDAMKKKEAPAEKVVSEEKPAEETVEEKPVEETVVEKSAADVQGEEKSAEENTEAEKTEEEKPKKSFKDFFSKAKSNDSKEVAEGEEKEEEKTPIDPEKKARLKKSLKIFAIVIAAVIALSIVYYFIFGTNNAPTGNNIPGNSETQQYEDIDQLIEDLQ